MDKIRYVCISDLHLGSPFSLGTSFEPSADRNALPGDSGIVSRSPVVEALVRCLRSLPIRNSGKKPTLVLNGDAFELALMWEHTAAMAFERFLEVLHEGGSPFANRILFVPGNHDHHLWQTARESQYAAYLETETSPAIKEPWYSVPCLSESKEWIRSPFVAAIARRMRPGKASDLGIVYPNAAALSRANDACVVFSHGHFIDPLYTAQSIARKWLIPESDFPTKEWQYEQENFAWIDFVWSSLGRCGKTGKDFSFLYYILSNKEDPGVAGLIEKLVARLADALAERIDVTFVPELLEDKVCKLAIDGLLERVSRTERKATHDDGHPPRRFPADAEGLARYLSEPVARQVVLEARKKGVDAGRFRRWTFAFGHTHKPFQALYSIPALDGKVRLFNTGGWVVESMKPDSEQGAAVLLLDDDLNAAMIRVHTDSHATQEIVVEEPLEKTDSSFRNAIANAVAANKAEWDALASRVATARNELRKAMKGLVPKLEKAWGL